MKPEGVPLPVQGAASDPAHSVEAIASSAADAVAIELCQRGSPGVLALEIATDILLTLPEVVPRPGFEHDHADASPG